jgi:hypothetical protein
MYRRTFLSGVAVTLAAPFWSRSAQASTAIGLTTEELVRKSERVSVGRAVDRVTSWTHLGGSRRIVTLHRILETERLESDGAPDESWVLTLGGRIGDLGQKVSGEAEIEDHSDFVLFLGQERLAEGVPPHRRVVGMAQGAYSVFADQGQKRLRPGRDLPHLMRSQKGTLAVDDLRGLDLESCRATVRRFR